MKTMNPMKMNTSISLQWLAALKIIIHILLIRCEVDMLDMNVSA